MATPTENANILIRYWTDGAKAGRQLPIAGLNWANRLADAMRAMDELVQQAGDPYVRRTVFAPGGIFETALITEPAGPTDAMLAMRGNAMADITLGVIAAADRARRPPRLIMLDKIHTLASGGWWAPPQPAGVTDWLKSVSVSAGAMWATITADPRLDVRKAAAWLIEDKAVAIPVFWAEFLLNQRAFEALEEQLKTAAWSVPDRTELTKLAANALARSQDVVRGAAAVLPSFPTGDGAGARTSLPAKAWYRNGRLWASASLGLVAGAAMGARPSHR